MESRHTDDALAMRYMQASPEERQRIADQISKQPGAKALRILLWISVPILFAMLGYINWLILVDLAYMKPNMFALVLIDLFGLAGIGKAIMFYQCYGKPSIYGLMAEYKARNGTLPPK